jgi:hypothetical protein
LENPGGFVTVPEDARMDMRWQTSHDRKQLPRAELPRARHRESKPWQMSLCQMCTRNGPTLTSRHFEGSIKWSLFDKLWWLLETMSF